jgi:hypothetical protein
MTNNLSIKYIASLAADDSPTKEHKNILQWKLNVSGYFPKF